MLCTNIRKMKIGGRYYHVDWVKFKENTIKKFPESFKHDHEFKKNELKALFRIKVGIEKKIRKEK